MKWCSYFAKWHDIGDNGWRHFTDLRVKVYFDFLVYFDLLMGFYFMKFSTEPSFVEK